MKRPHLHRRAVALLITLACLVIMTIIIVGFAISMRTDRPTAATYFEKMRAAQFAQTGVETAVAKLHQYAAAMSGSGVNNWISQPGELVVNGSSGYALTTVVPLSSGSAVAVSDPSLQAPNLNVPMFRDQYNLISDGTTPLSMPVAWIYVRSSGSLDLSAQPALNNTSDPIVGRYAYWMDDESSKINYNIAWGRDASNTDPPNSLTHVDLTALSGFTTTMADAMRSALLGSTTLLTGSSQLMGSGTNQQFSFFNTPEDARRVESIQSGVAAALGNNQFDVTHYNHDPDMTFFNQPRIVLTTQPSRAGWTYKNGTWSGGKPYLDILTNTYLTSSGTFADPGPLSYASGSTIDYNKLTNTIYFLMSYMQRTDWPMIQGSGNSLQGKYYPVAPYPNGYPSSALSSERLAQLAVDIIDYVRSKESPQQLVCPLRVTHNTPASYPVPFQVSGTFPGFQCTSGSQPAFSGVEAWTSYSYMGLTRAPRITEMADWFGPASNAAGWGQTGFPSHIPISSGTSSYAVSGTTPVRIWEMEAYLPKHYGIQSLNLTGSNPALYWYINGDNTGGNGGENPISDKATYCTPSSTLTSGSYVTVRRVVGWQYDSNPQSICFALSTAIGTNRLDKTPLTTSTASPAYAVTEPPNAVGTPESQVHSFEVDDPRVNRSITDWRPSTNANHNTFGAQNSIYSVGKAASSVSPQPLQSTGSAYGAQLDTDSSGNITDASLYMPPPAGQIINYGDGFIDDNSLGVVQSVAELGYISTGVECVGYVPSSNGATTYVQLPPGRPWRTIRLQPNDQEATIVPDWAFMDLFTVPAITTSSNAQPIYAPHGVSVGGRVNVNSRVAPFGMQRLLPLTAVLQGCPYDSTNSSALLTATAAQSIAQNIINQTVATGANSGKMYASGTIPSCYNSPGQVVEISGVADQGEKSEALIRAISNLITARGSVFSAYTIGQALKQTPNGKIVVTGEQRLQAMIESYLYTNPTSGATSVRFNPVYYRNLTP